MEKMMKKIMFALLAVVCSSLMAQVLVYDYSASFKRIEVTPSKKIGKYYLDSPKVASDKFTGYMVIDACQECNGAMAYSGSKGVQVPGNPAVVYIVRNGSKSLKDAAYKKAVYRAIGRFYAVKFGAKPGVHYSAGLVNGDKFTDAAGFLSYAINAGGESDVANQSLVPGFLGYDHIDQIAEDDFAWFDAGASGIVDNPDTPFNELLLNGLPKHEDYELAIDFDTVDHAGFGKVSREKIPVQVTCMDDYSKYCWTVKNLSGSMVGGFAYGGYCSTFLFDVCKDDVDQYAPISGTFNLKWNKKLTAGSFGAAETAVLKKLGNPKFTYADPDETTDFNAWLAPRLDKIADWPFWY